MTDLIDYIEPVVVGDTTLDERITVAIPSFRRAGNVKTLKVAPFAKVWVPETQAAEYRKAYGAERVVSIDPALDGNIARKRNAILDYADTQWVLMLDDDILDVAYWEGGERIRMGPEQFLGLVNRGFWMADDAGVTMWGINQAKDAMFYRTMTPFSFLASILGPFCGHLREKPYERGLRYDESVAPKEDYDFWLKTILRERRTFRLNKYHYVAAHGAKQAGGLASMRSSDGEWEKARKMERRWGRCFRAGGTVGGGAATGKNVLNSLAKVPIPGT